MSTDAPRTKMSTAAQFTLVTPIPRRARAMNNRPASAQGQKQLSSRCGSASAPDPHATRTARLPRSTISKLTIVRMPQPKEDSDSGKNLKHQRSKTVARTSGLRSESPSRLSFASTTFAAPTAPAETLHSGGPKPASPSRKSFASASFTPAGRSQPSPATRGHTRTASASSQTFARFQPSTTSPVGRLLPGQVYDLAKTSSRPSANVLSAAYAPSTLFMPVPEDVYLPFLDRPSEVLELLSKPANSKIMVLFARMIPTSNEAYYPRTSAELAATVGSWTFEDFTTWLTQVSREEIDDADWVHALRTFVLPKSEVLWERLKSMLGIPPDLDVGYIPESMYKQKESALDIAPIYPAPSSRLRLDDISETVENRTASLASEIVGLRLSTPPSFPPTPSLSDTRSVRTVPSSPRARTPVHGYAPAVSSPLVPKSLAQPRPRSAPPAKNSSSLAGLLSRIRSKEAACPMFPSSFDKLGIKPSLLRIA